MPEDSEENQDSYLENLQDSIELYENQYDRIDQDQERIIDRGHNYFKVYLISTSVLVSALSLGKIDFPTSTQYMIYVGALALAVNVVAIWKLWRFIAPKDFIQPVYDLKDEEAMLSKETIEMDREDYLTAITNRWDDTVQQYQEKVHEDDGLSDRLGDVHQWVFLAFVSNVLIVLALIVI